MINLKSISAVLLLASVVMSGSNVLAADSKKTERPRNKTGYFYDESFYVGKSIGVVEDFSINPGKADSGEIILGHANNLEEGSKIFGFSIYAKLLFKDSKDLDLKLMRGEKLVIYSAHVDKSWMSHKGDGLPIPDDRTHPIELKVLVVDQNDAIVPGKLKYIEKVSIYCDVTGSDFKAAEIFNAITDENKQSTKQYFKFLGDFTPPRGPASTATKN